MTAIDSTNRFHLVGTILNEHGRTGLEVDQVLRFDIEPEEPVEPVGTAQPAYAVVAALSRRTRRQR